MSVMASPQVTGASPDRFVPGLQAHLSGLWGARVGVSPVTVVSGGNARPTWRCEMAVDGTVRGLILRVKAGTDLGLSEFRREFDALRIAFDGGLPVPEPLVYSDDHSWVGAPYMLIAEIPNCLTSASGRVLKSDVAIALGRDFWSALGRIGRLDVGEVAVPETFEAVDVSGCWVRELDRWSLMYDAAAIHPNPIVAAAQRWMRSNSPAPAQKLALVHGDYRLGNILHDADGTLTAILDWEMAHFGDPLEDLAWTLDPRQEANHPELAGGLLPHARAIALWEEASGLAADAHSLHWWQVFSAFKALTIWTIAANNFATAQEKRAIDGRMGWLLAERQQRVLLDLISPFSDRVYYRPAT